MVKLILFVLALLAPVACDQVKETTDVVRDVQANGLSVNTAVDITLAEWEMKQVDGVFYFLEITAGIITQCIVLDTSGGTLYSETPKSIVDQDALRVTQPTDAQITECPIR
jgi:hypothetical protein